MAIDYADEATQKWMAAKGKYDENNLIHRFRFWRFSKGFGQIDAATFMKMESWEIHQFERVQTGNSALSFSELDRISKRIEYFIENY